MLGGIFNVILAASEKRGGVASRVGDMEEVNNCMAQIGVSIVEFDGSLFTWTNGYV